MSNASEKQITEDAFRSVQEQPLEKIRQLIAQNMQQSWTKIPHVTHHDEVDITALSKARVALNEANDKHHQGGVASDETTRPHITMLPIIIKGLIKVLQSYPEFNASFDEEKNSLLIKDYFNIDIAVDTSSGLIVPVIHNAEKKTVTELAASIQDLAERANNGQLGFADIEGGSFSVTSLDKQGGTAFTPIIKPDEVAILGISRTLRKVVAEGDNIVIRDILPLSLSYDHRVVDGAKASRLMSELRDTLCAIEIDLA